MARFYGISRALDDRSRAGATCALRAKTVILRAVAGSTRRGSTSPGWILRLRFAPRRMTVGEGEAYAVSSR
jgi:hypothetical protein